MKVYINQISFDGVYHVPVKIILDVKDATFNKEVSENDLRDMLGKKRFVSVKVDLAPDQEGESYGVSHDMTIGTGLNDSVLCFDTKGVTYYSQIPSRQN